MPRSSCETPVTRSSTRERRGQAELSKGERELTFGECPSEALVGVGVTLKSLAGDALSGVTWPGAARFPDVESEVRDMLIGDGVAPEPMMLSSNVLTRSLMSRVRFDADSFTRSEHTPFCLQSTFAVLSLGKRLVGVASPLHAHSVVTYTYERL